MPPTTAPKAEPRPERTRRHPHWWLWLVIAIVAVLVTMAAFLAILVNYQLSTPKNAHDDTSTLLEIKAGNSLESIAANINAHHLIRAQNLFVLYAKFGPAHGKLLPGVYELKPNQSIKQMVGNMHAGRIAVRTILVPEGLTAKQIGKRVQQSSFASAADFATALTQTYTQPILQIRPPGTTSLEGLLGPGKYQLVITAPPTQLVNQMINKFASSTASYQAHSAPQGLSFYQALTLASMVELEAPHTDDRKLIAGVFLNRLRQGMKLESDTTVNYALAQAGDTTTSSSQFINYNSPYNTYKIAGLPPTPICNPSLDALDAVYNPTPSNYLYFIGGKDGKVYYAATLEQHQANISKYLQ